MANESKAFTPTELNTLWGNIDELEPLSRTLLLNLYDKLAKYNPESTELGEMLTGIVEKFDPFNIYYSNYNIAVKLLSSLEQNKKQVTSFSQRVVNKCNGMTLAQLLIVPVQRIPRFF